MYELAFDFSPQINALEHSLPLETVRKPWDIRLLYFQSNGKQKHKKTSTILTDGKQHVNRATVSPIQSKIYINTKEKKTQKRIVFSRTLLHQVLCPKHVICIIAFISTIIQFRLYYFFLCTDQGMMLHGVQITCTIKQLQSCGAGFENHY